MKLKSAVIGFSYLAGLICAFLPELNPVYSFIIMAAGGLTGIVLIRLRKPDVGVLLLVSGIAFGVYGFYRTSEINKILLLDGQTHEITGVVLDKTMPSHDMAGYTIEAVINGTRTRFSLYARDAGAEVGDSLSFEARFSLLRDNTAFAEASYYMSRGVFLKAAAVTTPVAYKNDSFSLTGLIRGFNERLKSRIMTAFPNDTGALICAVFMGDKSALSPSLSQSITRAGASHYASVSGLHLTLMAHMFMSVLGLTRLRVMRKLKFTFLTLMTLTFMVFFNLSPSVTRAGIMLIVFYGGELFMRRGNTLNSIGFAALIILLVSPYSCLDAGLLLSIAGTIGIGVAAPAINRHFETSRTRPVIKNLREAFIMNLCANYTTLPLVAVLFGGVSLVSAITSIILLPFFTIMLTAMVVFGLSAGLDGMSLLVAGLLSRLMEVLIGFFGGLKFAYIPLDYAFVLPWVIASAVFITLTGLYYKRVIAGVRAALISIFTLALMVISTEYLYLDKTRLDIYTDGTSACIFLRNRTNSVVIVTNDGRRTAQAVSDFISGNFLDEISLLILINSTNNSLPVFEAIPSLVFVSPDCEMITYDVGGVFTVTGNTVSYNDTKINVGHIREPSNADINITYNFSVHAAEFPGTVIHTSRRAEAGEQNEFNAYYERISWILE
ncbi:MAG: ComEC/Rec2 family competence protein [Oscillospiraceae bacterium]|jgi:ComEC/Rec2-related protein|nr:ComEC/Rec2 family competence protein [Oscillospiraceae bacterium]